jgi:hypothetical protein
MEGTTFSLLKVKYFSTIQIVVDYPFFMAPALVMDY